MKIRNVDKNFISVAEQGTEGLVYYDITKPPFTLHGIFYDEGEKCYKRLKKTIAAQISESVEYLSYQTAGGRVRFSTDAKTLSVAVKYPFLEPSPRMTLLGRCGFALCENTKDGEAFVDACAPQFTFEEGLKPILKETEGYTRQLHLIADGKIHDYTLYFPLGNYVNELRLGFPTHASVGAGLPYRDIKPILYYGSSITEGFCAGRADNGYTALISKKNNVDFINMGFSGNAKAEPNMIEYLAGIDCSVFVFDYDHNAPTVEFLKATHEKAYLQYRERMPNVPILFVSKPDHCDSEDTKARFSVIKKTYTNALQNGDKNVYLLDGRTLFGQAWRDCTVEGLHPTDLGFYFMAKKIGGIINKILREGK